MRRFIITSSIVVATGCTLITAAQHLLVWTLVGVFTVGLNIFNLCSLSEVK